MSNSMQRIPDAPHSLDLWLAGTVDQLFTRFTRNAAQTEEPASARQGQTRPI